VVDSDHVVSNGLDLLPTFCDYAGARTPEDLQGLSLRPLLDGSADGWRKHVQIESQVGFAVAAADCKYLLCKSGANREQLYDLQADPGETRNFATEPDHAQALEAMREAYSHYWPEGVGA
jgi:arylsulfatase A-like enzyme